MTRRTTLTPKSADQLIAATLRIVKAKMGYLVSTGYTPTNDQLQLIHEAEQSLTPHPDPT
jgi:hypothetical protein